MPEWFWKGEKGSSILSIGTGKAYFERKFWNEFDNIYVIDQSELTRLSLEYFPISNAHFISKSLFDASIRLAHIPRYCWLGASLHYIFAEFHGWAFLQKLAMMVSDTLLIDAGVLDADSPQGVYLLSKRKNEELFERYRMSQFSYKHFRESTKGLWSVVDEWPTTWIRDGRRTLILKRNLPPTIQKRELGRLELVVDRDRKYRDNWRVFRTKEGYYKETKDIAPLLMYDALGKIMVWDGFTKWVVYDEREFSGFVVTDYGDKQPADPSVSEELYLALVSRCLPLGFLPADVARENIRIHNGSPIWIDIECVALNELNPFLALWATTNTYKEYDHIPSYIDHAMYDIPTATHTILPTATKMDALPPMAENELEILVKEYPPEVTAETVFHVTIEISNHSSYVLNSWPPYPVNIAYHWMDEESSAIIVFDGGRSPLAPPLSPGSRESYKARITAPSEQGRYALEVTLVQEDVRWFDLAPSMLANVVSISVKR